MKIVHFIPGFYRVLYDTVLTQSIKNQLMTNHNFISSRTRSQLLDDYFTSAWQSVLTTDNFQNEVTKFFTVVYLFRAH